MICPLYIRHAVYTLPYIFRNVSELSPFQNGNNSLICRFEYPHKYVINNYYYFLGWGMFGYSCEFIRSPVYIEIEVSGKIRYLFLLFQTWFPDCQLLQ
jgi:hypothetical protein